MPTNLRCDEFAGVRTGIASATANQGEQVLVLLHGYGADELDLLGVADSLPGWTIACPRGPVTLPWGGRAWYELELVPTANGVSVAPADYGDAARACLPQLTDWLTAWTEQHPGSTSDRLRLVVGGFSQGASVALQLMRLAPATAAAYVCLSGFIAGTDDPGDAALTDLRPPVFWGRGDADAVVPQWALDATAAWLPPHTTLTASLYPGLAHGISAAELADLAAFLSAFRVG